MKIRLHEIQPTVHIDELNPVTDIIVMVDEHNDLFILQKTAWGSNFWGFQGISAKDLSSGNRYRLNGKVKCWKELINSHQNPGRTFYAFKTPQEFFQFAIDFYNK